MTVKNNMLFYGGIGILLLLVICLFGAVVILLTRPTPTSMMPTRPAVAVSNSNGDAAPTMMYEEVQATQYWATDQAGQRTQQFEATANYVPPTATPEAPRFKLFVVANGIWVNKGEDGWTNYTLALGITNLSNTKPIFQITDASVQTKTGESYPVEVRLDNATFAPIPAGMSVVPVCSHGACGDNYGTFSSYLTFRVPSTLEPIKATVVTSVGVQEIAFVGNKDVLSLQSLNQDLPTSGQVPFTIIGEYVTMTVDSVTFSESEPGFYDAAQFVKVKFTVSNSDPAANHYSPVAFLFATADGIWMDEADFYSGMTNTVVEVGPLQTKTVEIMFDIPNQYLDYSHIYMVGLKVKPDSQYEYDVDEAPVVIRLK